MMQLARTPPPSMEALLYHAQMQGILPPTSRCNMQCIFCSNAYNPETCEVFTSLPGARRRLKIAYCGSQAPGAYRHR